MSWDITVKGVSDAKLASVLKSFPKLEGLQIRHVDESLDKPKHGGPRTRPQADMILTMTGRIPRSDRLKAVVTAFEKLEAKHGIGTVTYKQFKDHLKGKKIEPKELSRALREKYLEGA